jgi:hypothetical protein
MGTQWEDSIRKTGTLTIYRGTTASGWSDVFTQAVTRFNALATTLSINVTFVATTTPPDPNNLQSTNVQFETADGHISFPWLGDTGSDELPGDADMGLTRYGAAPNGLLGRAFIFVPRRTKRHRFMKLCMTVHELVHATGLCNDDHSSNLNADIFSQHLVAAGNKVEAGIFNSKVMPPIWMSNETAGKINTLWPYEPDSI